MAQAFDPVGLQLRGEAVPAADQVESAAVSSSQYAHASVSDTGVLAYRRRETFTGVLVWVDWNGREQGPAVQDPSVRAAEPPTVTGGKARRLDARREPLGCTV